MTKPTFQLGAPTRIVTQPTVEKQETKQLAEVAKGTTKHLTKAIRVFVDTNPIEDVPHGGGPVPDINSSFLDDSKPKGFINFDHLLYKIRQADPSLRIQCLDNFRYWISHVENDQYSERLAQFLAHTLSETHPKVLATAMENVHLVLQQSSRSIIKGDDLEILLVRLFAIFGDFAIKGKKQIKESSDSIKARLKEQYDISSLFEHTSKILQSPECALDTKILIGGLSFLIELIPEVMKTYPSSTRIPGMLELCHRASEFEMSKMLTENKKSRRLVLPACFMCMFLIFANLFDFFISRFVWTH